MFGWGGRGVLPLLDMALGPKGIHVAHLDKGRDELKPRVKREGCRTQEGSWQTLRWRKGEGLLSRRTCQQVAGKCAVGCPSITLVGTKLISTLPHLTFRRAEM